MSFLNNFDAAIAFGWVRAIDENGANKWLANTRIASLHTADTEVIATTDNDNEHVIARCASALIASEELIEVLKLLDPMPTEDKDEE